MSARSLEALEYIEFTHLAPDGQCGIRCRLIGGFEPGPGQHYATEEDIRAAGFVRLATGSDVPTGGETYERFARRLLVKWTVPPGEWERVERAIVDRDVDHYNAGAASRQPEVDRLTARVAELEAQAAMACIEPDPKCQCAGCLYADEVHR